MVIQKAVAQQKRQKNKPRSVKQKMGVYQKAYFVCYNVEAYESSLKFFKTRRFKKVKKNSKQTSFFFHSSHPSRKLVSYADHIEFASLSKVQNDYAQILKTIQQHLVGERIKQESAQHST